jgi:hypothetical protein
MPYICIVSRSLTNGELSIPVIPLGHTRPHLLPPVATADLYKQEYTAFTIHIMSVHHRKEQGEETPVKINKCCQAS